MEEKNKVEILITYQRNDSGEQKQSFIENESYETALRKFLQIKGGKEKITILSIQDWDRREKKFTIASPITLAQKDSVVYKIMHE